MADGFGMLEAQQRIGAELPYKNIEQFREGVGQAVNAWRAGAEINIRKGQLERQLEAMALRNQQTEFMNQNREQEFQRKLDQGNARLEQMALAQNTRDIVANWKMDKDRETMEDIGGLAQGIGAIDLPPDDPKRPSAIWDVIQKNARAAKAAPGLIKDAFSSYNTAARTRQSKWSSDYNDFIKDVKNTVGRGQITDLNLLYNMDQWKDQWYDKGGNPIAPPAPGEQPPEGAHKTGNKFTYLPSSTPGGAPIPVTLPAQKLTELNQRLKELDNRRKGMPEQVSNEYATPQMGGAAPTTMRERAMRIQGDPSASAEAKAAAEKYLQQNSQ